MDRSVVAVVGLGYVGLPLAVEFGRRFRTIGFDISQRRVGELAGGEDSTGEVTREELRSAQGLEVSSDPAALAAADFVIVAVPTPVHAAHQPDFGPLLGASETVGRHMKQGVTVIYESTVYPGATEEVCVPVLERCSGLKWKAQFSVGYSPERINPGDREHTLSRIVKVVSGDSQATLDRVAALYGVVVTAGVHRASSIRVAEAAKVIENTQRDLNIALMNELSMIFDRLGLDTLEVLEAAGTKWNFLPFRPGLVGGHCIGVDPYYLTHKAEAIGYHPQVILSGRRINDDMGKFVAEKTVKLMTGTGSPVAGATVNLLGLTFKENCPDIRNTRVIDIIAELRNYGVKVFVHDPLADPDEAKEEDGEALCEWSDLPRADAIIVAVAHQEYLDHPVEKLLEKLKPGGVVVDVKSKLDRAALNGNGISFWRL